ncbi:MAG TPA: dTMP kinase [Planctomycetota bacterium]|nr:dTMP kinase [Planctomycetota bacterium]
MQDPQFFGLVPPPYFDTTGYEGKLIVIEGTDGVGRTTQIERLKEWLEVRGHAVIETGLARSELVGDTIDQAKEGHSMNRLTMSLLYATDFADRLEKQIIPALKAGYVVLADRYFYTAVARAKVRGADAQWVRDLFGFALMPDLVLYLKADVKTVLRRVLSAGVIDYWEAGRDLHPHLDTYDSFIAYQTDLLQEFDKLAVEFGFRTIDARLPVAKVQDLLREHVGGLAGPDPAGDESSIVRADDTIVKK